MPYARSRVGRLFYREYGTEMKKGDPAIVLLHGFLFEGGMWRHQVEPLSELGRVIVFDGPGHGKSEDPPEPYRLEEHVDGIAEALTELGVERAIVVGLSWGGMLAMRFALQHPSRTAGLALLDTSAEIESRTDKLRATLLLFVYRHFGLPPSLFGKEIAPKMFGKKTRREHPEIALETKQMLLGFSHEGVVRTGRELAFRKSILSNVHKITAPTLVMCGSDDTMTVPARSHAIATRIAGARLVMLDDAGHLISLEKPNEVNSVLVPFVAETLKRTAKADAVRRHSA